MFLKIFFTKYIDHVVFNPSQFSFFYINIAFFGEFTYKRVI